MSKVTLDYGSFFWPIVSWLISCEVNSKLLIKILKHKKKNPEYW
jgi:hypothetical protein